MKFNTLALSTLTTVFPTFSSSAAATVTEDVVDLTLNRKLGKAAKSSAQHCPVITDVTCGQVFNNSGLIILGQDLICKTKAGASIDAAITLVGKDTVLDCQGRSITQVTNSSASAIDCTVYPYEKGACGLFYGFGFIAAEGATVKNCNVNKFYYGGSIVNGGVVDSSDFSLNSNGLFVSNRVSNTTYKVTKSNFFSNNEGLRIQQQNEGGGVEVLIEDVVSNNNNEEGILVSGTGFTIRNVDSSNNGFAGLVVAGYPTYPPVENPRTEITLDGKVSLNNNGCCGLQVSSMFELPPRGTVRITGELITDRNKYTGVDMIYDTNINIVLANGSSSGKSNKSSSGSLTACGNGEYDIVNQGDGSFGGSDYTCNSISTSDNLPVCNSCPKCSNFLFA